MDLDFTYCPVNLGITQNDIDLMREQIISLPNEYFTYNGYRNLEFLNVYTEDGILIYDKIMTPEQRKELLKRDRAWSLAGRSCPHVVDVFENKIFPIFQPILPRVQVLRTPPGVEMKVHVDCHREEFHMLKHNLKIVVSGDIGGLYFIDEDGSKVHIPDNHSTYIIDSRHPHAIDISDKVKLTFIMGRPWNVKYANKLYFDSLDISNSFKLKYPYNIEEYIEDFVLFHG